MCVCVSVCVCVCVCARARDFMHRCVIFPAIMFVCLDVLADGLIIYHPQAEFITSTNLIVDYTIMQNSDHDPAVLIY